MAKLNAKGTIAERFWRRVLILETGCWEWTGAKDKDGYGAFSVTHAARVRAHRWAYETYVEHMHPWLQSDHICKNKSCVNPLHIEPVTARENVLRSNGPAAINAKKTHCYKGHNLSGDNLILRDGRGRQCRTCEREYKRWRRKVLGLKD